MLKGSSPVAMWKRAALATVVVTIVSIASTTAVPWANAAVSSHTTRATGCSPKTNAYPGSRSTDCVALSNSTVYVDGTVVLAKWSLTADKFGFTNLCAAVTIHNQNKTTYFFNDFNMTLRPPKGSVTVLNFTAKHSLEDGFIAPGGSASGNICFDYFGQSGQYVAMYSPHVRSPIRGIWLVNLD
jgi:hypothetical protein